MASRNLARMLTSFAQGPNQVSVPASSCLARSWCSVEELNVDQQRRWSSGHQGQGGGKGSSGGTIREGGGSLGQFGAAQEEGYFHNKKQEQLKKMKDKQNKQKLKKEAKKNTQNNQNEEKP
ncbi:ATPase inhibitor mai-1, mitochondrial [Plutella xylostella]|uniref:ATPase inhibitor mai-1, mitochondrial n=1 Tax=Plutella xylostella TaxID=51655 RepID=UPI00203299B7|nr:ATPase inhibitor mai-1, mitochondrial [Plutella xylostella]